MTRIGAGQHDNGWRLARIFHEDVPQAQQLGSWQGCADFDPAGNAEGIPITGPERDL